MSYQGAIAAGHRFAEVALHDLAALDREGSHGHARSDGASRVVDGHGAPAWRWRARAPPARARVGRDATRRARDVDAGVAAVELLLAARTPVAIAWGPELLTLHNDAFAAITGTDRAEPMAHPLSELCPELWRRVGPVIADTTRRGEAVFTEDALFCIHRNGHAEEIYASLSCHPIPDRASPADGVLIMLTDSTEQVVGARRTAALRDVAAAAGEVSSVDEACHRALDAVSRHSADVPFALLYAVRAEAPGEARLAATAGLGTGLDASPSVITLGSAAAEASWPLAAALETNGRIIVDDLPWRFDPLPAGNWPLAPRSAVVVPLTTTGRGRPDAALVVGASARRPLDAPYLDFIELVARHVAAAMVGGRLHEDEARRTAARAVS